MSNGVHYAGGGRRPMRMSFLLAPFVDPNSRPRKAMIVVLLLLGILIGLILGAAGAAAAIRPNRERQRDELKSISADVLAQTGDSLAQRLAEARRAEEERAAGEMALRSEELKQMVGPVHE